MTADPPSGTDADRQRVYRAQHQVLRLFDDVGRGGDGDHRLPLERRFGDRVAVQRYCDAVLDSAALRSRYGPLPRVTVVTSRAVGKARYRADTAQILMPTTTGWADRELVVLHEIAHHVSANPNAESGVPDHGHGPYFRSVYCDLLDLVMGPETGARMRRAFRGSGLPLAGPPSPAQPAAEPLADRSTRRISALLSKAARTSNTAEAEAYLAKAQGLARVHAIDLEVLQRIDDGRDRPTHRELLIGEPRRLHTRHLVSLIVGIGALNDVRFDIARDSTYVIAYGFVPDIDVTEKLFTTVAVHMTTVAHHYMTAGTWKGTTYTQVRRDAAGRHVLREVAHTARSSRLAFYRGYVDHVVERLRAADPSARTTTTGAAPDGAAADRRAVLLAHKSDIVASYRREHSRARGTYRSRSVILPGSAADLAGRAAADRVRLGHDPAVTAPRAIGSG